MSLISDIQTIITDLYPSATLKLSSKFEANIDSFFVDDVNLPLIIIDNEFDKDNEIQINNNVLKNHRILISFLNQDSPDNTDAESEVIRAAMEAMADRVAVKIYQIEAVRIKPITARQKYRISPLFHVFNTTLTGVGLEMLANYNEVVNF